MSGISRIELLDRIADLQRVSSRKTLEARRLLELLKEMRSYFWSEGYADQTPVMAKADALIAKLERAQ